VKNPSTGRWNPIRHDYLDVSGQFIGFYSASGANPAWGKGIVAGQNEQDNGRCSMLCNDDKFDAYVLAAAQEIGAPTYCAIASAEFGLTGLAAEAASGVFSPLLQAERISSRKMIFICMIICLVS